MKKYFTIMRNMHNEKYTFKVNVNIVGNGFLFFELPIAIGIFLSVTMVLMHQAEYLKRQIGKPAQKGV